MYKLVIFSSVVHHKVGHVWVAHGGFVREIDLWAKLFQQVYVAGLCSNVDKPKSDAIPYSQPNVSFISLGNSFQSNTIKGRLRLIRALPNQLITGSKLLDTNTVVMARGPDGIGFLGVLLTRFNHLPRFAKYAGQWGNYTGEPLTYKLQRLFYRTRFFGGPVIANTFPNDRPHVVPLLNSSITRAEWIEAGEKVAIRKSVSPLRLLLVGRLTPVKGVDILLKAIKKLIDEEIPVYLDIVGDGSSKATLEEMCNELRLDSFVTFHGWQSRQKLKDFYSQASCLVSCSHHQGLDKVLLEGMTYALPIIATDVSIVSTIIEPPLRGLLIPPGDTISLVKALKEIIATPTEAIEMGYKAREKAEEMLLDDQLEKFRTFLQEYVGLELD